MIWLENHNEKHYKNEIIYFDLLKYLKEFYFSIAHEEIENIEIKELNLTGNMSRKERDSKKIDWVKETTSKPIPDNSNDPFNLLTLNPMEMRTFEVEFLESEFFTS